jgi:hypothetical protein
MNAAAALLRAPVAPRPCLRRRGTATLSSCTRVQADPVLGYTSTSSAPVVERQHDAHAEPARASRHHEAGKPARLPASEYRQAVKRARASCNRDELEQALVKQDVNRALAVVSR